MAASSVLPTYQRYVNGVPMPAGRKALRMREKYIIIMVFLTFGVVCFGAFFFLPDLRDRVNMGEVKKQIQSHGGDLFLPGVQDGPGNEGHIDKHGDVVDIHKLQDVNALRGKAAEEFARDEAMRALGKKLDLPKDDTLRFKQDIDTDKDALKKEQEQKAKELEEEQKRKAMEEIERDHKGHEGTQGGEPKDPETKKRRDKVREVRMTRKPH